jgi:DNA-binding NtrC family response regulator
MSTTRARILIADDEPLYLRTTGDLLRQAGYDCVCVPNAMEAIKVLREQVFDLLLSDLNMPGNLRLELLREQSQAQPHLPIIVVTGVPTLPSAIESIRLGITDYLLKPVKFDDLLASVRRALSIRPRVDIPRSAAARIEAKSNGSCGGMVGQSPAMQDLFEIIDRIAWTDTNVLITGESGTGKEVVAQVIHAHSARSSGPFQVIDCTAIPESLFESTLFGHRKGAFTGAVHDAEGLLKQADGGTAFFDELGELPIALQAKLLRAIQEQTFLPVGSHAPVSVNTRFICATNRDLQMEVAAGRFRQDLYYRLGVIHIELPPLRARGSDVIVLAQHFLETLQPHPATIDGFSAEAIACLQSYSWPGNIRELRNVVERAIALTRNQQITPEALPRTMQGIDLGPRETASTWGVAPPVNPVTSSSPLPLPRSSSRDAAIDAAEYDYLVQLLRTHSGNVSEAARQAGVSRQGLHKLLKKHHLRASIFRS